MISWLRRWFRSLFHSHRWEYEHRTHQLKPFRSRIRGPGKEPNHLYRTLEVQYRTCTTCGRVEREKLTHGMAWLFVEYVDATKLIEEQCHQEAIEDFESRLIDK